MQALWIFATILLLIIAISAAPQDQLLVEEPSYVIISTTSRPEEASEEDLKTSYTVHSSDRQKRSTEDDLNGSASAIVFRPLFVYRQQRQSRRRVTRDVTADTKHLEKRETPETSGREKRSLDSSDDLNGSNSGIVFRPLFAYRQQRQSRRRVTRDVADDTKDLPKRETAEDVLETSERQKRSPDSSDDLSGSNSGIVFRPLFAYRQQRQSRRRVTRDVADDTKDLPKREPAEDVLETSERPKRSDLSDDLSGSNSGIVFRPLFVYRQQRQSRRRVTRDVADDTKDLPKREPAEDVLETSERQKRSDLSDDLSGSNSGIVFRPLFAYRQQRQSRRRVTRDIADDTKGIPKSETAENVLETSERQKRSSDDLSGSSSGIVFRPLFTYRQQRQSRRRVTRDTADDTKDIPKSDTSEDVLEASERQKRSSDDLSGSSSGIVFRPLFAYRQQRQSRRRVTRDVPSYISADSNNHEDLETSNSDLVFRPLFTYREELKEKEAYDNYNKDYAFDYEDDESRSKRSLYGLSSDAENFDGYNSGIVSRPLFAYPYQKQIRREITRENNEGRKKRSVEEYESKEGKSADLKDLKAEESGNLVYKPVFRYKYRYVESRSGKRKT